MLDFMLFGFLDSKTLFLILHVFGVALGAGGALVSDGMFFLSTKDRIISKTEFGFLTMAHKLVSAGLFLLIISGALLFFQNHESYLASDKFLAKMSIIAILGINALVFHFKHIPLFGELSGKKLSENTQFKRASVSIYISGGISVVSWSLALILGMLKTVPYSYWTIMSAYLVLILLVIPIALLFRKKMLQP